MKTIYRLFVVILVFLLVVIPVACVAPGAPAGANAPASIEPVSIENAPTTIEFVPPNLCDPSSPTLTPLGETEPLVAERQNLSLTDERSYFVNERVYSNENGQHFQLTIQGVDEAVVARYIDEAKICFEAITMDKFTPITEEQVIGADETSENEERQAELEQALINNQSALETILFNLNARENNLLIEMAWLDQPYRAAGWRSYHDNTLPDAERDRFDDSLTSLRERFVYVEEQGLFSDNFVEWFTKNLMLLDNETFWTNNLSEGTPECVDPIVADNPERLLFSFVWCDLIQVPDVAEQSAQPIIEKFVEWLFVWKGNNLISDWWLARMVSPGAIHAIHFVVDPTLQGKAYHAYRSTDPTHSGTARLSVSSTSATVYVQRCSDSKPYTRSYKPSSEPTPLAFYSPTKTRFDAGVDGAPNSNNNTSSVYTIFGTWETGRKGSEEHDTLKLGKSADRLCS